MLKLKGLDTGYRL